MIRTEIYIYTCHFREVPYVHTEHGLYRRRTRARPLYNSGFEDEHEYENEYEKPQIRSPAYALHLTGPDT